MKFTRERWTVLRVLGWTRAYLRDKGIVSSRLESELLLSHILGCDRVGLYLRYDMVLSSEELAAFRRALERRTRGEPLQYITGYQEFWSIRFKVSPQVLIPRPETETLVEETLRLIEAEGWREPRIGEVGTGCGAIAISIVRSMPSARVVATDKSWEALRLARENAMIQDVAPRMSFVCGDLLSFVRPGTDGAFDVVISNPPYVRRGDIEGLQPEIRDFEPREAIDGGADGLDFHRDLLRGTSSCLRKGGWLVLEIGADQGPTVYDLAEQVGGFKKREIIRDYTGKDRVLISQGE
jgi:release factor glutamine methyltransferase